MCRAGDPCPLLDYDGLVSFTTWFTTHPGWTWRTPMVTPLPADDPRFGKVVGRVVRYAPIAPACIVPHELAHLIAGPDHSDAWWQRFKQLTSWVAPAG